MKVKKEKEAGNGGANVRMVLLLLIPEKGERKMYQLHMYLS